MSDASLPAGREIFGTWQTMDTAPKDRLIVVAWPHPVEVDSWVAMTAVWEKHRWWPRHGGWVVGGDRLQKVSPAYWAALRPLPPPPSEPVPTKPNKSEGEE